MFRSFDGTPNDHFATTPERWGAEDVPPQYTGLDDVCVRLLHGYGTVGSPLYAHSTRSRQESTAPRRS